MERDLQAILDVIKNASLEIFGVLKSSLGEYSESKNSSGDTQLKADVEADKIVLNALKALPCVKKICSEEQMDAVVFNDSGAYCVAYDPLDGSSLMGANLSVGSIFGIYKGEFSAANLVASAYVVYGMVVGVGFASVLERGVKYFIYDGRDFVLQKTLHLNESGKLNATGGTQKNWSEQHRAKMQALFMQGYRLRYSGGMVPDLHHILVKGGGLFSYPATSDAPRGKLRVLFEVLPFALAFKQAGGAGVDGEFKELLSLEFDGLHATTPCYFGSRAEVDFVSR